MKYMAMGVMVVLNTTLFVLCLVAGGTLGIIGAVLNFIAAMAWAGNIYYAVEHS